jgi:regulator of sigma E protease
MGILFAILLFGLLILIHELGHFLTAKLFRVQVNEFSLFMGPAIFKKKKGETVYALRCIPIGGYCAMEGEDQDTDSPRSFQKAAWWKRLIILLAGSFMNLLMGFILFAVVISSSKGIAQPVIAKAEVGCTVVREDGLQIGDRILEIDGEKVYVSGDFSWLLAINPAETHDLVVKRGDKVLKFDDYEMQIGMFPDQDTGTLVPRYGFDFASEGISLGSVLRESWYQSVDSVRMVRLSLEMLVTGQAGLEDMTGPVGMVQAMNQTAESSDNTANAMRSMLMFGALIAINLAVMNLLPIPALDGGRAVCLLLTTAYEKITKKKINPKFETYLHGIGMILLLALTALIFFKDIFAIFKG